MNRLKILRAEKDLSLRQLEERSGVDQSIISQLENGRRKARLNTLVKIARGLDVPVEELLELLDTTAVERGKKGNQALQAKKEDCLAAMNPQAVYSAA